jgi:hypothetical protein
MDDVGTGRRTRQGEVAGDPLPSVDHPLCGRASSAARRGRHRSAAGSFMDPRPPTSAPDFALGQARWIVQDRYNIGRRCRTSSRPSLRNRWSTRSSPTTSSGTSTTSGHRTAQSPLRVGLPVRSLFWWACRLDVRSVHPSDAPSHRRHHALCCRRSRRSVTAQNWRSASPRSAQPRPDRPGRRSVYDTGDPGLGQSGCAGAELGCPWRRRIGRSALGSCRTTGCLMVAAWVSLVSVLPAGRVSDVHRNRRAEELR